jgi:hypothetical protein
MTSSIATPSVIRSHRRQRRPLLSLLGATLVLLAGCAPRAIVRGADPIAAELQAAAERVDTTPLGRSTSHRSALAGAGIGTGASPLARTVGPSMPVAQLTARTAPARTTLARPTAKPALVAPVPVSALVGGPWIGHYAASGPARRTALGLALRAVAGGDGASAADHALTGELLLWVPAGASLFDAPDAARAPGRVVRVPLTRAHYAGGQLRVTTEPFLDPSCGCTVHGIFTGAVRADTLGGRFTLIGASTVAPRSGRWALVRRPAR